MTVVDAVVRGVKREVQDVKSFVQTPKGPFETLDDMVGDIRQTVFDIGSSVGINRPLLKGSAMYGATYGSGQALQNIRNRVQSMRSRVSSMKK